MLASKGCVTRKGGGEDASRCWGQSTLNARRRLVEVSEMTKFITMMVGTIVAGLMVNGGQLLAERVDVFAAAAPISSESTSSYWDGLYDGPHHLPRFGPYYYPFFQHARVFHERA